MKCNYCGTEAKPGAKYCQKCGKPLSQQRSSNPPPRPSPQPVPTPPVSSSKSSNSAQIVIILLIIIAIVAIIGILQSRNSSTDKINNSSSSSEQSYQSYVSYSMPIYYMSNDGGTLYERSETLSVGSHTIWRGNYVSSSDWRPTSNASCSVTVYSDGTASQDAVYFWFEATPVEISYNLPIYYMSNEGELLYDRTEILHPGTHNIRRGNYFSNNDWEATSNSSVTVTVYNDGTAYPDIVYFYFARKSRNNTYSTTSTATVLEKLYLRTGPGKPPEGQPNNSYETFMCPGAEVTVVAKAYHKSSGRWWLKLSGSVYDTWNRQNMNVTNYWTEYRYLDENSFDINSIPEVAGY